ncbi:MAG: hypothetical protein COW16_10545 [Sphingomonadales bacterium CG12_big_fil_rev_8_21_14_0_65_65_10]|nr:MAG: hypothetical protein COW16_10545 [Sphingomonadales bacterium CG12_big_fil_rev_8_21_14_0_65_65_10]
MMARSKVRSLAARYREHRRVFEYALDKGITPKEAEAELERKAARERWERIRDRLEAAQVQPTTSGGPHGPAPSDAAWMMRD